MQIIIYFLFLSLSALGFEECSPADTEKACLAAVCDIPQKRAIPLETEELKKAVENIAVDPELQRRFDLVVDVTEGIKKTAREQLKKEDFAIVAEEMINKPVEATFAIGNLFSQNFRCLRTPLGCNYIQNDLAPPAEGVGELFKILYERSLLFVNLGSDDLNSRINLALHALDFVADEFSKEDLETQQKQITAIRSIEEFDRYRQYLTWGNTYKLKLSKEVKKFLPNLQTGLERLAKEVQSIEIGTEENRARFKRRCQLDSLVEGEIKKNVTPGTITQSRLKVLSAFKNKFLANLSVSSKRSLTREVDSKEFSDNFVVHPFITSDFKEVRFLGLQGSRYSPPTNRVEKYMDLLKVIRAQNFGCDMKAIIDVNGRYDYENDQLSISSFSLLNGHDDVISHELGHWLSRRMKEKKMSSHSLGKMISTRNCIQSFYSGGNLSEHPFKLAGDKTTSEEDFADWFAAKLNLDKQSMPCELNSSFILTGTISDQSYLPVPQDTHSNNLFRELNFRIQRGKLIPQICKDLMALHPDAQPKKCD